MNFFFLPGLVFLLILPGCGGGGDTPGGAGSSPGTPTDQIVVINPGVTPPSGLYQVLPVSLPMPLFQSSSVIYHDPDSGRSFLFVLGGAYFDPSYPDPINVSTIYMTEVLNGALSGFWTVNPYASGTVYRLPNIRGHSSVIYNNEIYLMGGITFGGFASAILKSAITMRTDPSSQQSAPVLGNWTYVGSLPVAETGLAAVTLGSSLFVAGGIESGFPDWSTCILTQNCAGSPTTVFSNRIFAYSLPLPAAGSGFTVTSHSTYTISTSLGMFTPSAAMGDDASLWILGGWGPDPKISNTPPNNLNQIYQFNANSIVASAQPLPNMPNGTGLSKAASFYIRSVFPGAGQIFLIGGVSGIQGTPDVIHQEVYATTPSGISDPGNWTLKGNLPQAITCFTAAYDSAGSGMIFVIGGIDARDPSCISN